MANKENFLNFCDEGFGNCRQCNRTIAKRDGRNLRAGFLDENEEFRTSLIIVSETAFRCPFCFTYHDFFPFRKEIRR